MTYKKCQKNAEKFYCEKCNFSCSKKSNWNKHILTRKHINTSSDLQKNAKNADYGNKSSSGIILQEKMPYACKCGNEYKHRQSLNNHKKKCNIYISNNNNNILLDTSSMDIGNSNVIDKELVVKMITHNHDFMKEMMTKMMEIVPQVGNTINNTLTNSNNTNNNHFNIQMFLNEHCKNAMNLTDFIESLPITAETYDNTLENGLTKSMTHLITNGLSQLDVLERPIHCTDTARKTLYVKENNAWEKDNELLTLMEGVKKIIFKQRTMLKKWQNVNEGWDTNELLQEKMTRLVFHSMADINNDEREMGKIIRAISKNVYLDNDIKNKFLNY